MKRGAAQILGTNKYVEYHLNPFYDDYGERYLTVEIDRKGIILIPSDEVVDVLERMDYSVEDVS